MRIDIPDIEQADILDACIDNMDDSDRKTRLNNCKSDIANYSQHYAEIASEGSLSEEVAPETDSIGEIKKMIWFSFMMVGW